MRPHRMAMYVLTFTALLALSGHALAADLPLKPARTRPPSSVVAELSGWMFAAVEEEARRARPQHPTIGGDGLDLWGGVDRYDDALATLADREHRHRNGTGHRK